MLSYAFTVCLAYSYFLLTVAQESQIDKGEWVFPLYQSDVADWHVGGNYSAEWKDVPWPLLRVMLFALNDTNDAIQLTDRFDNTQGKNAQTFTIPDLDLSENHRWYLSLWGDNADGSNTPGSNLDSDVRFFLKSKDAAISTTEKPTTVVVTKSVGPSSASTFKSTITSPAASRAASASALAGITSSATHKSAAPTVVDETSDKSQATKIGLGVGLGLGIPLILVAAGAFVLYRRRNRPSAQMQPDPGASYGTEVFAPTQNEKSAPPVPGERYEKPTSPDSAGTRLHEMGPASPTPTPVHEIGSSNSPGGRP